MKFDRDLVLQLALVGLVFGCILVGTIINGNGLLIVLATLQLAGVASLVIQDFEDRNRVEQDSENRT